ncbi:DUF2071 domain-containing protein [Paraherbaspirillum soli]|uniref:DUF2071 domain-containing protein n=1 Tax=Paraherbaspirillum soli TaxID=631222 RepID=A0ABW0MCD3_9BURK
MENNVFVYPTASLFGKALARIANSSGLLRLRRFFLSLVPFLVLESDVRDVVYLTWLVEVDAVAHLVPPGVKLWQREGKTPFTILTYTHGHFGPAAARGLRAIFPSPLQSNWRLYVDELPDGRPAQGVVLFVKNIMGSALYAISSRLFSDALPTHLAADFRHQRNGQSYQTSITSGSGSAPSLRYAAQVAQQKALTPEFETVFPSWSAAVEFLSLQDSAIAHVDDIARIAYATIELPIALESVLPLELVSDSLECGFVRAISKEQAPFCFAVPSTKFKVVSERLL